MAQQDSTTAPVIAAVVVTADCRSTAVDLDGGDMLHELYRHIGCDLVDVVRLAEDLDMWVDDEGMLTNPAPNWPITAIARQCGFTHQPYFGVAVFTGGVDEEGNTRPLSEQRKNWLQHTVALIEAAFTAMRGDAAEAG